MRSAWHQPQLWRGRTRFSDSFRSWFGRFKSVTHFIVWLTVVVFIAQRVCLLFHWKAGNGIDVMPFLFGLNAERLAHGFIWQPLTYMLLHDGLWHILVNLLVLWWFGREVEYFIGPKSFTRLYVFAGLLGGLLWLMFNLQEPSQLVGASAAVIGCVIAFATLFPERDVTLLIFFIIPVTLRAKYIALIAIAFDISPLLTHQTTNVAHLAHLGGAALGYVYIKALGYGVTPRWLLWLRNLKSHRSPNSRAATTSHEEYIRNEIDPILDKISRDGMQSLTRRERKVLESAKDLMQKQQR